MKIIAAYTGTVAGFRRWLTAQKPPNVVSLRKYKEEKEQLRHGGRGRLY